MIQHQTTVYNGDQPSPDGSISLAPDGNVHLSGRGLGPNDTIAKA